MENHMKSHLKDGVSHTDIDSPSQAKNAPEKMRDSYDYENDDLLRELDGRGVKYLQKSNSRKQAVKTLANLGWSTSTAKSSSKAQIPTIAAEDKSLDLDEDIEFWQYKPSLDAQMKSPKMETGSPAVDIVTKIGSQTTVYLVIFSFSSSIASCLLIFLISGAVQAHRTRLYLPRQPAHRGWRFRHHRVRP